MCCLPQAPSEFRLLKALAEAPGVVLARAPEQEPELEPVVPVLVGLLALVVQLGLVVPVPVLVVQALLLAVLVARPAVAAICHAIQARARTAGARRRRPALARR